MKFNQMNGRSQSMGRYLFAFSLMTSLVSGKTQAQEERKIKWGGFLETQYAFDVNSPQQGDRAFTTQPARDNEFNMNLGFIEMKMETARVRSRFALQAGTSVQSNYSSEPRRGTISGGDLSRHVQEARVGYAIDENSWVDAGIFFAHVGAESWISRDNLTLTRSLVAEYSPYYLSGVKWGRAWSENLTTQILLTNGWQNISENNSEKNLGTAVEYSFAHVIVSYNAMFGNEISADLNGSARKGEFRHFHNVIVKNKPQGNWEWVVQADVGFQRKSEKSAFSSWWGTTWIARHKLNESQKISLRAEHYQDPDQIILVTGQAVSFKATGGSLGFDQSLEEGLLWRNEIRYLAATEKLFPKGQGLSSQDDTVLTTSLAISF